MPPKGKDKKKAPTPKTVKEVAQESAGVMWLMDRTGFNKKELVPVLCTRGGLAWRCSYSSHAHGWRTPCSARSCHRRLRSWS